MSILQSVARAGTVISLHSISGESSLGEPPCPSANAGASTTVEAKLDQTAFCSCAVCGAAEDAEASQIVYGILIPCRRINNCAVYATRYPSMTFSWIPRQNCFPDIGASNGSLSRRRPKILRGCDLVARGFGVSNCGPLTGETAQSVSRASTVENMNWAARSTAGATIWASAHGENLYPCRAISRKSVGGEGAAQ